jgi:hypothetical protein
MLNKKDFPLIQVLSAGIMIILAIGLGIWLFRILEADMRARQEKEQVSKTYQICKDAAKECSKNDAEPESPKQDVWGRNLRYVREGNEDCFSYFAISAGLDGEFGTDDDIAAVKNDYNKSRIVGKWFGSRAVEGWKGFKEGLRQKSKFEEKN